MSRLEELRRRYNDIFNEASFEISKCLDRRPWNPNKIIRLRDEFVRLAEELAREYERLGDTIGANHVRQSVNLYMIWYNKAERGRC